MSNSYFRFKQFTINQEHCAMKVGTDGVLLGAWVNTDTASQILDIGTGTGLIALMLAQRTNASIEAIEIDPDAAEQAIRNASDSPWKKRIRICHTSLQKFNPDHNYDLIVANPPFFSNALPAPAHKRAIARHDSLLSLNELLDGVSRMLSKDGRLGIILPAGQYDRFLDKASKKQLFPVRITNVIPAPEKKAKRVLAEFSFHKKDINHSELIIEKSGRHQYSEEYIALTKEYYLEL